MTLQSIGIHWNGPLVSTVKAESEAFAEAFINHHSQVEDEGNRNQFIEGYRETKERSLFEQVAIMQDKLKIQPFENTAEENDWWESFRSLLREKIKNSSLRGGVENVLEQLKNSYDLFGIFIYSRPEKGLEEALKTFNFNGMFDFYVYQEQSLQEVHEHIEINPQQVLVVSGSDEILKISKKEGYQTRGFNDPELPKDFNHADQVIYELEELL